MSFASYYENIEKKVDLRLRFMESASSASAKYIQCQEICILLRQKDSIREKHIKWLEQKVTTSSAVPKGISNCIQRADVNIERSLFCVARTSSCSEKYVKCLVKNTLPGCKLWSSDYNVCVYVKIKYFVLCKRVFIEYLEMPSFHTLSVEVLVHIIDYLAWDEIYASFIGIDTRCAIIGARVLFDRFHGSCDAQHPCHNITWRAAEEKAVAYSYASSSSSLFQSKYTRSGCGTQRVRGNIV